MIINKNIFNLLQGLCFLSNTELALGEDVITFPSPFEFWKFFSYFLMDLEEIQEDIDSSEIPYFNGLTVRKRKPSDPEGKTIKDAIKEAIDSVVEDNRFFGSDIKLVSDNESPFIMIAFSMQDALSYTIDDFKNATEDSLFSSFVAGFGYDQWMALMSTEEVIGLFKHFFDKCYPLVKDKNVDSSSIV